MEAKTAISARPAGIRSRAWSQENQGSRTIASTPATANGRNTWANARKNRATNMMKITAAVSMIAAATTETAVTTRFFCLGDSSRFK